MGASVRWDGLDDFKRALRNLPEDLAREASGVVTETANAAKRAIQDGYPVGPTGNLKNRVTVSTAQANSVSAVAIVRSAAPHASIFERGTKTRHTGAGANRGRMPRPDVSERMIPKVQSFRARMVERLIEIVKREGLEVDA